jgi:hypothetical protein
MRKNAKTLTTTATGYVVVLSDEAAEHARSLARGCYQRAILDGTEALSGATLRGRAKRYSARYAASREALLARCTDVGEARGAHGRRVLVIGVSAIPTAVQRGLAALAARKVR